MTRFFEPENSASAHGECVPVVGARIRRGFWPVAALALFLFLTHSERALGQFLFTESFQNSTATGWTFGGNGVYTPTLTSGTIDPTGQGWLRLTDNSNNVASYGYLGVDIPSANNNISVTVDYAIWNGTGADGITVFLYDAAVPFNDGAYGGSLGYANRSTPTAEDGVAGGFIGAGIDEFGNFSNPTEGRNGGVGFVPDSVAIRGPGSGQSNYLYLGGTGTLPQSLDFPTYTTRPDQSGDDFRRFKFEITADNVVTVFMQFGSTGTLDQVFSGDLSTVFPSGYSRPENLRIGFTSSTGGSTNIHEIRNLTIEATQPLATTKLWDNNTGSSQWGTGANWSNDTAPSPGADIVLNDTFVSDTQTITVGGSRTVKSILFDAPFSYTVGSSAHEGTLIFDPVGNPGTAFISAGQINGSAAHTINSDIQMNVAVNVTNDSGQILTINGNIANGGNFLTVAGDDTTKINGVISGAGGITKTENGTLTLTADNTFTGVTNINGGTIRVEHAGALGAAGNTRNINATGTLQIGDMLVYDRNANLNTGGSLQGQGFSGFTGVATVANNANVTLSTTASTDIFYIGDAANDLTGGTGATITVDGPGYVALLQSNNVSADWVLNDGSLYIAADNRLGATGNNDVTFNGGALMTDGTFSLSSGRNVAINAAGGTVNTNSGTLTYAGSITGSGDLNKTGAGTLVLSGTTTAHSGNVNINTGTLTVQNGSAIDADSTVTVASGATFNLGNSEGIGAIAGAGLVTLNANTLTTGANNQSTTFSGVASGTGGITKTGTGTLTLSGNNTFTGSLSVNGGTVALGGNERIANGVNLTLNNGTFDTGGFSETMANITYDGASFIDFQNGPTSVLTFTGAGTRQGTGDTLTIDNWAGTFGAGGGSQLFLNGAPGANFLANISFAGYGAGAQLLGSGEIIPLSVDVRTWNVNGSQIWNTNGNWTPSGDPDGTDDVAIFGNVITSNATVTVTGNRTVGHMAFNDNNNYTIAGNNGAGGRDLDIAVTNGNTASINIAGSGSHTIANTVRLDLSDDPLTVNNNGTGTFTIAAAILGDANDITFNGTGATNVSGVISGGAGTDLTKNGTGVLTLSGTNTFQGGVTVNGGVLSVGADANLGNAANNLTLNGGTLTTTAGFTMDTGRDVTINSNGGTFNTTGTLTYNGVIAGSGDLIKTGSGILSLGGATTNTHTGDVTITAGEIQVNKTGGNNRAFGDLADVSVAGTLTFNNNTGTYSETIGSFAGTGTLNLNDNSLITGGNNADTTFSGTITGTGGALTKSGTGKMILSGAGTNTFTGAVSVTEGTLNVQKNSGLGTTAGGATVASGAALELEGGVNIGSEALTLSGTGVSSNGVLRSVSGANQASGGITLSANSEIQTDAGSLTLSGNITGTGYRLTMDGEGAATLSGAINTGAGGSLTKNGEGSLTLSGSSNYTGTTNVNAGRVLLTNNNALGTTAGGTNIQSEASVDLNAGGLTIGENFSINGYGDDGLGAIQNLVGSNTLSGNIAVQTNSSIGAASGTTLTHTGVVSGTGSLNKAGLGTTILTGASNNTFTGNTNVDEGVLDIRKSEALGTTAGATYVTVGATLAVNNASGMSVAEDFYLNGAGVSSSGALRNDVGNNSLTGGISLVTDASVGAASGTTLTHTGIVSGPGDLTKTSAGTFILGGTAANTYSGDTIVNQGTLQLQKTDGTAAIASGDIIVNTGGTLLLGQNNQISDSVDLTLDGGVFNSNGFSETLGSLTLTADSTIDFGSGTSILNFAGVNLNGFTLVLANWSGTPTYGYGTDQLLFRDPSGLPSPGNTTGQIRFGSLTGQAGLIISHPQLGFPNAVEVVPEPDTMLAALLLASVALRRYRRPSQL